MAVHQHQIESEAGLDFNKWLKEELCKLNTDENIFGSYIIGILEGDESHDEKAEALQDILSEITNNDLDTIVNGIIDKWNRCHQDKPKDDKKPITVDVDAQLAKLLESQKINQTTVQRQYTADELRIREQILAQYSQQEVDENDDVANVENHSSAAGLVKNTNALDVQQAMKERREQAKLESQKKKEKDKEDREKQKQMKEEKKEKRKTVKGERRR